MTVVKRRGKGPTATRIRAKEGMFWPAFRWGTILAPEKPITDAQAYELGNKLAEHGSGIINRLATPALPKGLVNAGIRRVSLIPPTRAASIAGEKRDDNIRLHILPMIVLTFPRMNIKLTSLPDHESIEMRISLTLSSRHAKSKIWIRFSSSHEVSWQACAKFHAECIRPAKALIRSFLRLINSLVAGPLLKRSFLPYFNMAIAVHSTSNKLLGDQIEYEAFRSRSVLTMEPTKTRGPALEMFVSIPPALLSLPHEKVIDSRGFAYLVTREPSLDDEEFKADVDVEGDIASVGSISVYSSYALIVAVAYERWFSELKTSVSTATVLSAELASEFGGSY